LILGERIRPRTKNVNYHILNPEKYSLATFPDNDQTEEAVENLLRQTEEEEAAAVANGDIYNEEVIYFFF